MTIDPNTLLFFDATCLIAASGSPSGGSGFLLSLCARGYLKPAISQPVLLEAQRIIQDKLGDEAFQRFYTFLAVIPFALASLPEKGELKRLEELINRKDMHVVAAAMEVHAPFLISLDKGRVLEINQVKLAIQALTPGDFIINVFPQHVNYPPAGD